MFRRDGGGENVDAWVHLYQQHQNPICVIVGSSVHNVCIERLWWDVHRAVLDEYCEVFSTLEDEHILDPDNDVDMYCLHEVFTVRINRSLREFVSSWNNHPISSERNMTPLQLFHIGLMETEESSNEDDHYTVPVATDHVQVPHIRYCPCSSLKSQICEVLQHNAQRDGCDVYRQVPTLVKQHLVY